MFLVEWPGGSWEATARLAAGILVVYLLIVWAALVFWTYRDIRQRSRDPIVQTVAILVVLFFFLPGHWIYLVLRPRYTLTELYERSLEEEALLQELEDQKACPSCKRRVLDQYLVCPSCRTQLKEPCRNCANPLSYAWVICPYCATEKPQRAPLPPQRPARSQPLATGAPRRPHPQPAVTAPPPQRPPARVAPIVERAAPPSIGEAYSPPPAREPDPPQPTTPSPPPAQERPVAKTAPPSVETSRAQEQPRFEEPVAPVPTREPASPPAEPTPVPAREPAAPPISEMTRPAPTDRTNGQKSAAPPRSPSRDPFAVSSRQTQNEPKAKSSARSDERAMDASSD